MTGLKKYAGLPDLDLAPDIYETPELIDDNSTYPPSTPLRSPTLSTDGENTTIDRHPIDQEKARVAFVTQDERSLTSAWQSHSSRQPRMGEKFDSHSLINGIGQSTSTPESLERRIARLKQELLEVAESVALEKPEAASTTKRESRSEVDELEAISKVIDQTYQSPGIGLAALHSKQQQRTHREPTTTIESLLSSTPPSDSPPKAINADHNATLANVVEFDERLKALETTLGLDNISMPSQDQGFPKPLLSTIDLFDQRLAMLGNTSNVSLDSMSEKIKQIVLEMDKASQTRVQNQAKSNTIFRTGTSISAADRGSQDKNSVLAIDSIDQDSKINALYGTLTTIESLAPLLPATLDRLRSLRELHANAADASQLLTALEQRQDEVDKDLKSWRGAVNKVEAALAQNHDVMRANSQEVEKWVKDLEQRINVLHP